MKIELVRELRVLYLWNKERSCFNEISWSSAIIWNFRGISNRVEDCVVATTVSKALIFQKEWNYFKHLTLLHRTTARWGDVLTFPFLCGSEKLHCALVYHLVDWLLIGRMSDGTLGHTIGRLVSWSLVHHNELGWTFCLRELLFFVVGCFRSPLIVVITNALPGIIYCPPRARRTRWPTTPTPSEVFIADYVPGSRM